MEEPIAEGLLVAGGATEVEGSAGGSQGEGISAPWRSIRDGEGEAATPRKNLTGSSSLPRRNLWKEFRTPQVSTDQRGRLMMTTDERLNQSTNRIKESRRTMLETEDLGVSILQDLHQQRQSLLHAHTTAKKSSKPVENSQLQPDEPLELPHVQDSHAHVIMERDTDSTASSPQPPLPIGKDPSSRPAMRFPKPTGVRNAAGNHGIPANGEHLPSKNTSRKTSPMKVQKPIKIKR